MFHRDSDPTPAPRRARHRIHARLLACLLIVSAALTLPSKTSAAETPAPPATRILLQAILEEDSARQIELLKQLPAVPDELLLRALTAWRAGELYLHESTPGSKEPILLEAQLDSDGRARAVRLADGQPLRGDNGVPTLFLASDLTAADTGSRLRRAIKSAMDLFAMANPNPKMRRDAVIKLGQELNPDYLPAFQTRLQAETIPEVRHAIAEAIALTRTRDTNAAIRLPAIQSLADAKSINALSFFKDQEASLRKTPKEADPETQRALASAIYRIENYIWWGTLAGTAFRGLSLSAVLLVAALGLAITFGLMGVINMAHGEVMAVGAYTTFAVQGLFGASFVFSPLGKTVTVPGLGLSGAAFDLYFPVALVASFVTAALVGLALERGIIRFLYKRPLESLLATWGVSLVLQQLFRHTFGAANVQVGSPAWLSGSFVVQDVLLAYNRLFIIAFALFIVAATWLLLVRTSLGLQIRAVMQNRAMASCVGVRTDRVNMMTFAFGSGLAGMAGACLSQIANVGPSLGQSYIVDCFMIVVLGGVGNLVGTVSAALGVGVTDQILQPWLGAVMGKITVLAGIILFLQWRPAGLFVTRSRSLDS